MEGEELPAMPSKSGSNSGGGEKRRDGRRKRRFSDEQVRSLECMFEAQTKLEPRRKAEVAGELGLQPRQVTVWFQNRRARWKSKQLEMEYGALQADYDALLSSFESLKREKQILAAQLQKLAELLAGKHEEESSDNGGDSGNGSDSKGKENRKPCYLSKKGSDGKLAVCSDEEELACYKQHPEQQCVSEAVGGSFAIPDQQRYIFDAAEPSYGTPSDWWELWH